jgi:hypothetical protein
MNLNELEQLYREIEARLDEPDFDAKELIDALSEQVEQKVNAYCWVIGKLLAREQWAKEEARRLQELGKIASNEANRLREHLLWFMEQRNIQKLNTDRYRVSVAGNGGKPPLLIDGNIKPENVPDCFRKVTYEFNTEAIRQAAEIGAIHWAKIGTNGKHLRIK